MAGENSVPEVSTLSSSLTNGILLGEGESCNEASDGNSTIGKSDMVSIALTVAITIVISGNGVSSKKSKSGATEKLI